MFEKLKFMIAAKKFFKMLGEDPNQPTANSVIVMQPWFLLKKVRKDSVFFQNDYLAADAMLMCCAYAKHYLKLCGVSDFIIADLQRKFKLVISSAGFVCGNELEEMVSNRVSFFGGLLEDRDKGMQAFMEETSLVFAHDLHHQKYVEYNAQSPLVVIGIFEQMRLEAEAKSFFKVAFDLMKEYLAVYAKGK